MYSALCQAFTSCCHQDAPLRLSIFHNHQTPRGKYTQNSILANFIILIHFCLFRGFNWCKSFFFTFRATIQRLFCSAFGVEAVGFSQFSVLMGEIMCNQNFTWSWSTESESRFVFNLHCKFFVAFFFGNEVRKHLLERRNKHSGAILPQSLAFLWTFGREEIISDNLLNKIYRLSEY